MGEGRRLRAFPLSLYSLAGGSIPLIKHQLDVRIAIITLRRGRRLLWVSPFIDTTLRLILKVCFHALPDHKRRLYVWNAGIAAELRARLSVGCRACFLQLLLFYHSARRQSIITCNLIKDGKFARKNHLLHTNAAVIRRECLILDFTRCHMPHILLHRSALWSQEAGPAKRTCMIPGRVHLAEIR